MRQKQTITEANAPVLRAAQNQEQARVVAAPAVARLRKFRFGAIAALTTLAVLALYSQIGGNTSGDHERLLVVGIHAVPALVAFVLGWRLRNPRRATRL